MGRAVERLAGRYITAEDVGTTVADFAEVRRATRHVVGLPVGLGGTGDPSPTTALGVFHGLAAAARHRRGAASLAGQHVAVQDLGNVGWHLCQLLHEAGASLTVSDLEASRAAKAVTTFAARAFKAILRERAARPEAAFSPLRDTLGKHRAAVVAGFGITIAWTVCTYFFLVTMPTYAVRQLGVPQSASLLANSVGLVVIVVLAPVFGSWSDKIGRRPIMLVAALGILVLCWPLLFWLSAQPGVVNLVVAQIVFAVLIAGFKGARASCDGGTLSAGDALDRSVHRLQSRSHDLRRVRAFHHDLAHRPDRELARAGLVRDAGGGHQPDGSARERQSAQSAVRAMTVRTDDPMRIPVPACCVH